MKENKSYQKTGSKPISYFYPYHLTDRRESKEGAVKRYLPINLGTSLTTRAAIITWL